MRKPFEQIIESLSALTIGTVESVSPSEIKVLLELEAPQATALNTGVPTGFPRINSYVLVPNEVGAVVGMIVWLGVERSSFPKRKGLKDFDVIDLPFPLRKLTLAPVGTLTQSDPSTDDAGDSATSFKLERGVTAFPSVGDPVVLPTTTQLTNIIEASGKDRRVEIGTSPMSGAAKITVDPDRLFGRHLAVLGNTGSGKSCTVAGLIRWSLEAAQRQIIGARKASGDEGGSTKANARFIILDPNGEYQTAFQDIKTRIFRVRPAVAPKGDGTENPDNRHESVAIVKPLQVPAWLWNSHEWAAFAGASEKTQRPLLMRAIRDLRSSGTTSVGTAAHSQLARNFRLRLRQIEAFHEQGPGFYGQFPGKNECGQNFQSIATEAAEYLQIHDDLSVPIKSGIEGVRSVAAKAIDEKPEKNGYYPAWDQFDIQPIVDKLRELCSLFPRDKSESSATEDTPVFFDIDKLPGHLEVLGAIVGGNSSQHIATMTTRIRTMLSDQRLRPIIDSSGDVNLAEWLQSYIGANEATNGEVTIIDLALVPSDIISVVISVIARMIFEAAQRYVKLNEKSLPTVLVLEEAHTFINRYTHSESDVTSAGQMCRHTFERIAREGRKFGLGLVLSSQRPSELSPTVLAQCNTFILHRIVNDEDQKLVSRLVPDSLGGLLKELSSLPSRRAILLGWATPIPTLLDVNELERGKRPNSDDPDFWDVWTLEAERTIDWERLGEEWSNPSTLVPENPVIREGTDEE